MAEKEEGDWYAWMCTLDWPSDHYEGQVWEYTFILHFTSEGNFIYDIATS